MTWQLILAILILGMPAVGAIYMVDKARADEQRACAEWQRERDARRAEAERLFGGN